MRQVEKFAPTTGIMLRADIRGHEAPPYTTCYVLATDYAALEAECERLRELLASSREFVAAYVNNAFFGPSAKKELAKIDAVLSAKP